MDYSTLNDYELLYLIKDGIEVALEILHKKYYHLIYTTATAFYPDGTKLSDLVQEGRIVLQGCIYSYNSKKGVSFYSYFLFCYKRRIYKLLQGNYFKDYLKLEEDMTSCGFSNPVLVRPHLLFEDEEEQRLYREIFLEGSTITDYAFKHEENYSIVYRKYTQMISKLKRWISE